MAKAVFCILRTEVQASRVVGALKGSGFSNNDISVVMADKSGARDFAIENQTKTPEGAAVGASTGAAIGGVLGWLTGTGAFAIPGLGPFIAAGPILAALSGVAVGGTLGGIAGALVGMGIPEFEARRYEGKVNSGNMLLSVHTEDAEEVARAQQIFETEGAEDIQTSNEAALETSTHYQPARVTGQR
jgi:hypothetical protein